MLSDRILFSDAEVIVLDKPAGVPVTQPKRGGACLEDRLGELRLGFVHAPLIVHRLDQDTSGCLLLARHRKALKRFNAAFAEGRVAKTYWAVLAGVPEGDEGMIDLALAKRSTRERGWWVEPDPKGKPARTAWRVLARYDGRALIEFSPETGRTHQLRAHALAGFGAAIAGDPVYGGGQGPMLLHARSLELEREGKQTIAAIAPLAGHFPAWAQLAA